MGLALPVNPNPVLRTMALVPLVDVELAASFPLNLGGEGGVGWGVGPGGAIPWAQDFAAAEAALAAEFDAPPVRWSTRDLPTAWGQYTYRILGIPEFDTDRRVGVTSQLTLRVRNDDGLFNPWFGRTVEYRGKIARLHLYDAASGVRYEDRWVGALVHCTQGDTVDEVVLLFVQGDLRATETLIPRRVAGLRTFGQLPAVAGPTGGAGATLPVGIGIGRNLPARLLHVPRDDHDRSLWRVGGWMGHCAVHAVYKEGTKLQPFADYVVRPRLYRPGGRPCTTVELFVSPYNGPTPAAITADVERRFRDADPQLLSAYLWADGFWEWVGGRHARSDTLTTAHLVTGRGGAGTGAVRLTDPAHSLTLPVPADHQRQEFTIDHEVLVPLGAPAQTLVRGAGALGTDGSYQVEDNGDDTWTVRLTTSAAAYTHTVTAPRGRWHTLSVVVFPGQFRVQLDGAAGVSTTTSGTVLYPDPLVPCRVGLVGEAKRFDCGALQWWTARQAPEDVTRTHYLFEKSPAEGLREMLEEAREVVDHASCATVAALLATAGGTRTAPNVYENGYGLRADGWVVNPVPATTVYQAFGAFRDLEAVRNDLGVATFRCYQEPEEAALRLWVGGPTANAILRARLPRSEAEAVRVLPIRYRQQRGPDGSLARGSDVLGEYAYRIDAYGEAVGREDAPLDLPFVDDHRTADLVRDWFGKRLAIEKTRVDLLLNHESRLLTRGEAAVVTIHRGGVTDALYRLTAVPAHRLTHLESAWVPFDARLFDYSASETLPEDHVPRTVALLDPGDDPELEVTDAGDLGVDLTVRLWGRRVAAPTHVIAKHGTVGPVGAAGILQALATTDGYVQLTYPAHLDVACGAAPAGLDPRRPVDRIAIEVVVRSLSLSGEVDVDAEVALLTKTGSATWTASAYPTVLTHGSQSVRRTFVAMWDEHPVDLRPWSYHDVPNVGARFTVADTPGVLAETFYIESLRFLVYQSVDTPTGLGRVVFWLQASPNLPPATQPTDPALRPGNLLFAATTVASPGTYHGTARLYDRHDREVLVLGPTAVEVA